MPMSARGDFKLQMVPFENKVSQLPHGLTSLLQVAAPSKANSSMQPPCKLIDSDTKQET